MIFERSANVAARLLGDDEVDVALAIALLHVGQAVVLVRQTAQRLRQQADSVDLDREFAGLGAHEHARGTDDVTEVPAFEGLVGFLAQGALMDEQLDATRAVLHLHEADLALSAHEDDTAGNGDATRRGLDGLRGPGVLVGEFGLEIAREAIDLEVVRIGDALRAQRFQFLASLGDEAVLVGGDGGGFCVGVFGHGVDWRLLG